MKQVALVTGSSRGIGLGIAKALAASGFDIALNAPVDDAELAAAVKEVEALGAKVVKFAFDVSDLSVHDLALQTIEAELGPLTTLVNNAGVSVLDRGDMLEVSEASFDRCMNINAKAVFFLSQAFGKRLLKRERDPSLTYSIVNITSSSARAVSLNRTEYCVSKAAAAMISQALAVRLGPDNVAVFDVQPGLIATDMTKNVIADYEKRAKAGLTLMPRIGTPEDMGKIVASLATGAVPYMTGQVISADGGLLVQRY